MPALLSVTESRSSDVSKLLVTVILADAEVICGPPGETDAV